MICDPRCPKLHFAKLTYSGHSLSLKKKKYVGTYFSYTLLMYQPKMYFPPHHKKHYSLLVFYINLHHCQNKLSHGALFLSAFISPHWYDDVCDHVYLNMYGAAISVCTICMCVNLPKSQVLHYLHIHNLQF